LDLSSSISSSSDNSKLISSLSKEELSVSEEFDAGAVVVHSDGLVFVNDDEAVLICDDEGAVKE